ncbi:GerMN domain-containing protein [Streptomyces sp. NPDC056149]|uniref:GerMN domain-containing protein n=1 Tax=unclassified Streptomyces TaxID=2593676 RepID=UPI0023813962|nr:GerMN domain-containing protein [Streptomyces sp. WZ-12]
MRGAGVVRLGAVWKAVPWGGVRPARAVGTALLVGLVLAGCGVPDTGPEAAGAPARGGRAAHADHWVRVYFAAPNGTWPVARAAPAGAGPQRALDELLAGPTRDERERGLSTALPTGTHRVRAEAASPGTVTLQLPWLVSELDRTAVNQLVCTAAAAPGVAGGRPPTDVVVQVYESGLPGEPWTVTCDETGAAVPVGAPRARH